MQGEEAGEDFADGSSMDGLQVSGGMLTSGGASEGKRPGIVEEEKSHLQDAEGVCAEE